MLDAKIVVPTNEILQVYRKKVLLLQTIMKQIEVVAAIIRKDEKVKRQSGWTTVEIGFQQYDVQSFPFES